MRSWERYTIPLTSMQNKCVQRKHYNCALLELWERLAGYDLNTDISGSGLGLVSVLKLTVFQPRRPLASRSGTSPWPEPTAPGGWWCHHIVKPMMSSCHQRMMSSSHRSDPRRKCVWGLCSKALRNKMTINETLFSSILCGVTCPNTCCPS